MISHDHQCIFIHIPKCAGTSIETALGHLENHHGRFSQDHRSIRMIEQPFLYQETFLSTENIIELLRRKKYQHFKNIHNPKNKYTVTKQQYNSYFKFTIIRNPWSRAFSWYKNVIRDDIHRNNLGLTTDITFKEFLLQFKGKKMLRPQIYWLKSFNGSIPMDYIGRFENLQEDIQEIFRRLKMENVSLPHLLNGPKNDYRKFYDTATNDMILNTYKEEINAFGYTFDK